MILPIKLLGLLKAIPLGIKKATDTGLIKPLPLTGLAREWGKVIASKYSFKGWLRFVPYIMIGFTIYGLIFKSLAPETAQMIFDFLASII